MEFALIFLITIAGLGEEIKDNQALIKEAESRITELERVVDENETTLLKLAAKHADFYARQQIMNEAINDRLGDHEHEEKTY